MIRAPALPQAGAIALQGVLPVLACGESFCGLALPVRSERCDGAHGQDEGAAGLECLDVTSAPG